MLERLVAGIVVIGALVWVASALATPDAPPALRDEGASAPGEDIGPASREPPMEDGTSVEPTAEPDDQDQDDPADDDDRSESSGKGRKGRRDDPDA